MIKKITKSQERKLQAYMRECKEDDEYQMTPYDRILQVYIPVKIGVRENGLNADEITLAVGEATESYQNKCLWRTNVCQFASRMIKEGYPFGALKVKGERKRYGWTTEAEFEELQFGRKERLAKETTNAINYLDDDDRAKIIGRQLLKIIDKQMKLTFESEEHTEE